MQQRSRPTISVVVPAYNVEAYINAALDSLLAQSEPFHQIIVVDDGSTDATAARLRPYAQARRIVVVSTANAGLGAARNRGAALARGDYLYFFDADDLADPSLCARATQALLNDPATDLLFFAGAAFHDAPGTRAALEPLGRAFEGRFGSGLDAAAALQRARSLHPSACLYISRSRLWRGHVRFAEIVHEDAELILRLCALAGVTQVMRTILFYRRQRAGSIMASGTSPAHLAGHYAALVTAGALRRTHASRHPVLLARWQTQLLWSYLKNCEQLRRMPPWRALLQTLRPHRTLARHVLFSMATPAHLATLLRIGKHAATARLRRWRERRAPAGAPSGPRERH